MDFRNVTDLFLDRAFDGDPVMIKEVGEDEPDGSLTGDGVKAQIRQHLLESCNLHTIVRLPNAVFQP